MDQRFRKIAAIAATQYSVVSTDQSAANGVSSSMRSKWERSGLIDRFGPRSFVIAGSTPCFEQAVAGGLADLAGFGFVGGRAAARLFRLDGFSNSPAEFLIPRSRRGYSTSGFVCSTSRPLTSADVITVRGFRCLTAERLIVESPLFGFDRLETENAIDSAIRLRLVSEARLRDRIVSEHTRGVNAGSLLIDALVDTGGESWLERQFLKLVREAGIDRPLLQRTYRDGGRVVARIDAYFPGELVVEVSGHGTHASRRQRQLDAQRHTELTLRGLRVITFTYEDVRLRPSWVIDRLREAFAWIA